MKFHLGIVFNLAAYLVNISRELPNGVWGVGLVADDWTMRQGV